MSAEDLKAKYRRTYAERSQARVVFILFKEDGTGGIQGILVDTFYINEDGKIANEFYLINDSGEENAIPQLTKIEGN